MRKPKFQPTPLQLYRQANRQLIKQIKQEARRILQKDANLDEFICGMGMWLFTFKKGVTLKDHSGELIRITIPHSDVSDFLDTRIGPYRKLNKIFDAWDEYFKLSGNSMRFRATGKVTTNW